MRGRSSTQPLLGHVIRWMKERGGRRLLRFCLCCSTLPTAIPLQAWQSDVLSFRIPFIFSRLLLNVLKTQKNCVKNSKTNQNPNIPIRHPQPIPFKITRRKLQQLLQPQELLPSRALFCCPQTSHKMIPRFRKRMKVFSHKGSLVLSFSLRRNSTRVYLFQLPARWWEHPPAFLYLTAIPSILHPCC